MSSATEPVSSAQSKGPTEVVVISHSPLFYWWPVWAVGFLMAALTYLFGLSFAAVLCLLVTPVLYAIYYGVGEPAERATETAI